MGRRALLVVLSARHEARVRFPTAAELEGFADLVHGRERLLAGCALFMDGLDMRIPRPTSDYEQNKAYCGWQHNHISANILVFQPDGCVAYAAINYPVKLTRLSVGNSSY